MTWLDILTVSLSIVACWGLAQARIGRQRYGEARKTGYAWVVLGAALAIRVLFGPGDVFDDLTLALRDFGIGLLLGSVWLNAKDSRPRPWAVLGAVLIAVWLVDWVIGPTPDRSEVLLELGPDDHIDEVAELLESHDATWEQAFPEVTLEEDEDLAQYYLIDCPTDQLEALINALRADSENVDGAEENVRVHAIPTLPGEIREDSGLAEQANDPRLGEQWALEWIDAHEAIAQIRREQPMRPAIVAIVDTGVDASHEDIEAIFSDSPGDEDGHGHGTHCAGIAGASTNNGLGIASLNWEGRLVQIRGYQGLTEEGWGTVESIAQAIIDATDDGVDVISLSLGGYHPAPPRAEVDAVEYALTRGVIVVAAAGNSAEDARLHAPANIPGVIVVAASDREGNRATFSNSNTSLQRPIAAPGVDILSLAPGSDYVAFSGTSMATPLVAGLIGVMRALQPEVSASEVYDILRQTGREVSDSREIGRIIEADEAIRTLLR